MIVFKSFSWILAVFSPILSLVLVPDHFERDAVCLLSQLTLTYKSLRHRSYQIQWMNECCVHTRRNIGTLCQTSDLWPPVKSFMT